MEPRELEIGDVLQIDPDHDEVFGGKFMVVTEPKEWGAQGYVDSLPLKSGETGVCVTVRGTAYYRCKFENMEYVGKVAWLKERGYEEKDVDGN